MAVGWLVQRRREFAIGIGEGDGKRKGRAVGAVGLDPDAAAVGLDEFLAHGEAEAGGVFAALGDADALAEDARDVRRRHAGAVVRDGEDDAGMAVIEAHHGLDEDRASFRAKADGVGEEIDQDAGEAHRVGQDRLGKGFADRDGQAFLLRLGGDLINGRGDQVGREAFSHDELTVPVGGGIQEGLDDPGESDGISLGDFQGALQCGRVA